LILEICLFSLTYYRATRRAAEEEEAEEAAGGEGGECRDIHRAIVILCKTNKILTLFEFGT
jgi:hypothetical protein